MPSPPSLSCGDDRARQESQRSDDDRPDKPRVACAATRRFIARSTGPSRPDALVDLVAGRLSFVFDPSLGQVQRAAVRALGVTAPEQLRTLPDRPTMGEAGREGFVSQTWNSIAAPAGTPDDIVAALNGRLFR